MRKNIEIIINIHDTYTYVLTYKYNTIIEIIINIHDTYMYVLTYKYNTIIEIIINIHDTYMYVLTYKYYYWDNNQYTWYLHECINL